MVESEPESTTAESEALVSAAPESLPLLVSAELASGDAPGSSLAEPLAHAAHALTIAASQA